MATDVKDAARATWSKGDFGKLADDTLGELGRTLVEACGIGPGQKVLDVGAGTGNASIPAAETGADVVASDLTPALLEAGRKRAAARGVELRWIEADAESLPFSDGEFDVVMSSIGVMFAPDHEQAAGELLRVARPGATIGLISWTPEGSIGRFFKTLGKHAPEPPPGSKPPIMWGSEEYVRSLLGDRARITRAEERAMTVDHFDGPMGAREYYKQYFGPAISLYEGLAGDPERLAALDRDFLAYCESEGREDPDRGWMFESDYLLLVAEKTG